jgi:hypothetical protein
MYNFPVDIVKSRDFIAKYYESESKRNQALSSRILGYCHACLPVEKEICESCPLPEPGAVWQRVLAGKIWRPVGYVHTSKQALLDYTERIPPSTAWCGASP